MKKILVKVTSISYFIFPSLVLAQNLNGYSGNLVRQATNLLGNILTFLISLAVVWFIWNVVSYAMSDDEEKKGKAKDQMIWGVIAIAVIVSVWGLVNLLKGAFGVDQVTNTVPTDIKDMIPPGI